MRLLLQTLHVVSRVGNSCLMFLCHNIYVGEADEKSNLQSNKVDDDLLHPSIFPWCYILKGIIVVGWVVPVVCFPATNNKGI